MANPINGILFYFNCKFVVKLLHEAVIVQLKPILMKWNNAKSISNNNDFTTYLFNYVIEWKFTKVTDKR
jgi:hypothetical protein